MRKAAWILLLSLSLSACGQSKTPLTHALAAFQSGDYDEFGRAKQEAADAVKTAIQADGDLCLATMMDVEKYGTVAVIEKLDRPELWKLSDDQRYVYALKLAGDHLVVEPGSLLSRAPVFSAADGPGVSSSSTCAGEKDKTMVALMSAGMDAHDADEARMDFMQSWMRERKAKYGGDYDNTMRAAASNVENQGYSVKWPASYDFMD